MDRYILLYKRQSKIIKKKIISNEYDDKERRKIYLKRYL